MHAIACTLQLLPSRIRWMRAWCWLVRTKEAGTGTSHRSAYNGGFFVSSTTQVWSTTHLNRAGMPPP